MTQATLRKWGNNLAVRLPGEIVRTARLHDSERVEIEASDGAITIRRSERPATLEELFGGKSPDAWRAAYADAHDWGPDIGREAVAE